MTGVPIAALATFPYDGDSPLHDLARAFRAGEPDALERVALLAVDAIRAGGLTAEPPGAVVVVPGHRAGSANAACTALAARIGPAVGWPAPVSGALQRIADAPEGRTTAGREPRAEASTLAWHPGLLPDSGPVLLLDDVVRTGATLDAAVLAAPEPLASRLVPFAVFRAVVAE